MLDYCARERSERAKAKKKSETRRKLIFFPKIQAKKYRRPLETQKRKGRAETCIRAYKALQRCVHTDIFPVLLTVVELPSAQGRAKEETAGNNTNIPNTCGMSTQNAKRTIVSLREICPIAITTLHGDSGLYLYYRTPAATLYPVDFAAPCTYIIIRSSSTHPGGEEEARLGQSAIYPSFHGGNPPPPLRPALMPPPPPPTPRCCFPTNHSKKDHNNKLVLTTTGGHTYRTQTRL